MVSHTIAASDRWALDILNSIRRIVQALRLFDQQAAKSTGLSGAQVFVLGHLGDGRPISINDLAARTCTDQSSVSVVAQKLVARKLARRDQSVFDARRAELTITPLGRRLLRAAPGAAQQRMIASLRQMTPRRRRQLAALLVELVQRMGVDQAPPDLFFEDSAARGARSRGPNKKSHGFQRGGSVHAKRSH